MSVSDVAALIALYLFPQTWKLLWAPVVDTTLTAKRWYLVSVMGTGMLIVAISFHCHGQAPHLAARCTPCLPLSFAVQRRGNVDREFDGLHDGIAAAGASRRMDAGR